MLMGEGRRIDAISENAITYEDIVITEDAALHTEPVKASITLFLQGVLYVLVSIAFGKNRTPNKAETSN